MINFFRKTRKKMADDNKFMKYLRYAIGEIVLVVIGILIALQINTWNNNKNLRKTEVSLLKEMKINLKADLADVKFNIDWINKALNASEIVLKSLKSTDNYNDTLNFYYANLLGGADFSKNTSAYDNLKSIGFHIIINDSLRINITNLYTNRYDHIDMLDSNYINNFYSIKLEPLIISNLITDEQFVSAKPINQSALAQNHEFKETIQANIGWSSFLNDRYLEIENDIIVLIRQIDSEIINRNN